MLTGQGQKVGKLDSLPISSSCFSNLVDGMWSEWSEFGECPVTCGGSTQERTRTCTEPAPANGGADCVGDATESQECGTDPCPGK